MTLAEIRQSDAALLSASDVAEVLESDPQDIRLALKLCKILDIPIEEIIAKEGT